MKTENFSFTDKGELFEKANPMHDCYFTASFDNNTLVLTFDNLDRYYDSPPDMPWFEGHKKLIVKYHGVDLLDLTLFFKKREKDFCNTVSPLSDKVLRMYKYSVDCFDEMTLDFDTNSNKKSGRGTLVFSAKEIEYIWE